MIINPVVWRVVNLTDLWRPIPKGKAATLPQYSNRDKMLELVQRLRR